MTLVSNVNGASASLSDSNSVARPGARKNPMSLAHLAKTAGVLALALSGGGQVAGARNSFGHGRDLQIIHPEYRGPYDYASVCDSGIVSLIDDGLSYEDCMTKEATSLEATRQNSAHETTKKCYTVAGYMTAGLVGTSGLATIGGTSAGLLMAGGGAALSAISLIVTSVCGIWHRVENVRLEESKDAASKCCRLLPKQADMDAKKDGGNKPATNSTALG